MIILYTIGIIFAIFIALIIAVLIMVRKEKDTFNLNNQNK